MTRSTPCIWFALAVVLSASAGCGDDGGTSDTSLPVDSGAADSTTPVDSGAGDTTVPVDSGAGDTTVPMDAGDADAGDPDAGDADTGAPDSGPGDTGVADTGVADTGMPPDAGMCIDLPPGDRVAPITCSSCRPTGPEPTGIGGACSMHSDCTADANGRCVIGMAGTYCDYDECFVDGDCDADELCSCDGSYGGGGNRCVPANCRVGSDCTSGVCSPSYSCLLGGPPTGWYCRTAADTCVDETGCAAISGRRCAFNTGMGLWECAYGVCVP